MKIAVSPFGHNPHQFAPFDQIFKEKVNPFITGSIDGCQAVLLWGGTDIHPSFYRQTAHPLNESSKEISKRDWMEWELIKEAIKKQIPLIGVCRGAQFLCAAAGGTLIQHVSNHRCGHLIDTHDNKQMWANGDHHQMMHPAGVEHELLAWKKPDPLTVYKGQNGEEVDRGEILVDPEVVYFPTIGALAIQPHPEWHYRANSSHVAFIDWTLLKIQEYLLED